MFRGISRDSSSPGRWMMAWRSWPISDCTLKVMTAPVGRRAAVRSRWPCLRRPYGRCGGLVAVAGGLVAVAGGLVAVAGGLVAVAGGLVAVRSDERPVGE